MNLKNSPLKKMKHGEINKPIISKPFNNTSDNNTLDIKEEHHHEEPNEQRKNRETTNELRKNIETTNEARANQERTEKKETKEKNTLHTFYINKDLLFTLQAIALFNNKPINNILNKALEKYIYNTYDSDTINQATNIYKQIKG